MKIIIFALGEKGFSVVRALFESLNVCRIYCVIGQDNGVVDDCSASLASYCESWKITYSFRKNSTYIESEYDLFLAVGWRWIISGVPQEKLIVFHDSLLPRYRGFAPLVNALINREKLIGVTALLGANEYDKGNILLQKCLEVVYPTNIEREVSRISSIYAELALDLFVKLNEGSINRLGYPQNEKEATYSLWRNEEDYRIDWNDSAQNIEHFIRCVSFPYLGASASLNGSIVRILKAECRADVKIENRSPGKVIFLELSCPIVVCGTGLLKLTDVLGEDGKSALPLKNFRSKFC